MELSLPSACFDTKLLPPRPETEECSDTWIVLKNVTCSKLMRSFSLHVPRLRCIYCNIHPDVGHSHTRPSCFFFLMQFASTSFLSPSPSHPPLPCLPFLTQSSLRAMSVILCTSQNPGYCEQEPPITRAPPSLPPPPRCAHTLPLNILLPTSYQSRQPKAGLVDKTLCYNFDEPSAASDHLTLCWIIDECCATCFEGSVCALYAHCESMNPGPASQPIYLLFSGSNYDAFARPT